jgi:hypothetical protein
MVKKYWNAVDSHAVFEAHLPGITSLQFVEKIIIPRNVYEQLDGYAVTTRTSVSGTHRETLSAAAELKRLFGSRFERDILVLTPFDVDIYADERSDEYFEFYDQFGVVGAQMKSGSADSKASASASASAAASTGERFVSERYGLTFARPSECKAVHIESLSLPIRLPSYDWSLAFWARVSPTRGSSFSIVLSDRKKPTHGVRRLLPLYPHNLCVRACVPILRLSGGRRAIWSSFL